MYRSEIRRPEQPRPEQHMRLELRRSLQADAPFMEQFDFLPNRDCTLDEME